MDQTRLLSVLGNLNTGQANAVEKIAGGWQGSNGAVRLTIVDGPPGTGKTHVAAAAAGRWVLDQHRRVIVLSPTHAAAERVHEKLRDVGFDSGQVLRLAHGRQRYDALSGTLHFEDVDHLPPNLRRVLQQADVLVTTWHGARRRAFKIATNFLLMIDEVSQVSFAAFLALLCQVRNLRPAGYALLGDPQQLPVIATQEILSTNAALGVLRRHPECDPCRLQLQYRMNSAICDVVNAVRHAGFRGARLEPGNDSVARRSLDQVTGQYIAQVPFGDVLDPRRPVVFVDTSRLALQLAERERAVGTSWEYPAEARLATRIALAVRAAYGNRIDGQIAMSSPYSAQVALMQRLGAPNAITIYKAQGHEWECVILSLARTTGRTIMDDVYQHMYVGLSRARAKLIVLINRDLFSQYRIFGSVLRLANESPTIHVVEANPDWCSA